MRVRDIQQWGTGSSISIAGWVQSKRAQKAFAFVALNDGSCLNSLQIVIDADILITTPLLLRSTLVQRSRSAAR